MISEEQKEQQSEAQKPDPPQSQAHPSEGNFFAQLRERNVIKVGAGYLVIAWAIMQVADLIFGALDFPPWAIKLTVVLLIVGAPIAIVGAWIYELTPQGLQRDRRHLDSIPRLSSRQRFVDFTVIAGLLGLSAYFGYTNIPRILERESQVTSTDRESSFMEFDINSIAVLPFENRSPDPEVEYFADGLTEEIVNVLLKLREFKCVAAAASFIYKSKEVPLADIARALRVKYLLTGSVRRSGGQLRISTSLVDAETGAVEWVETYDRPFADVFEIQAQIATAVSRESKIVLSTDSENLLRQRPTQQLAAYDFYLQGRDYMRRPRSVNVLESAASLFQKALALDENYALALAGLCEAHLGTYQLTKTTNWVQTAENSCADALAKDDGLSVVHAALGELYRQTGQLDAAEVQFRTALKLDPRLFEALEGLALTLIDKNQSDDALVVMQNMIDLQPGYWRAHAVLGNFLYRQGRDEDAIPVFKRVTELTPDNALAWNSLGAAHYMLGNLQSAASAWQKAIDIKPSQHMYVNLGTMYYYLGRYDEAADMQRKALDEAPDDFRIWGRLAAAYHMQDDKQAEASSTYGKAIDLAEAVLKINPENADALKNAGLFYARTGEGEKALKLTMRSLALTPKDPDTHFFAALVYCALEDDQACLRELTKSVDYGYSVSLIEQEPVFAHLRIRDEFRLLTSRGLN